ncbi:RHS repeat protein, partial [Salmonella enterica subsp. enterica]|nr:RHS repeat protein [Salmonella enterica subsp. enterica serovar Durham]
DRYYYDKAGNLLDNEGQGPVMNNRLPGCGRDRYGYNEWGELTTRRDQQLEWNAQGQLTRVISGNTETHYGYDALGRRIRKATYGRHTGHTARSRTDFVWEGFRLLQENVQQQGWRTYLYDAEQPYTPVASVTGRGESRQVWYYHTDVTGTPQEVTAADGTLVWAGYIRGFGENAADISNSGAYFHQPLRLPGQYFDDETGLHYNLFRYYAPECGRFVSQDPIGLAGGINLYQYAPNPLSWIDPLGLTTEYKSESPYHGRKPTYDPATHHDPSSPDFRGGGSKTTPLPPDAEEVYRRAVPSDSTGKKWYGQNSEGEFYRYQGQNGEVHWNGREKSSRGLDVPTWIRKRFNQMAAKLKRSGGKCG